MSTKVLQSRIICKHDTEENWNKAQNFIPQKGELIIYDSDSNYPYERLKVGNGSTNVASLPFVINSVIDDTLQLQIIKDAELNSLWTEVMG